MRSGASRPPVPSPVLAVLDVLGKVVLVVSLVAVLVDPSWGNLEGKAPTARALTYPLVAFAVPVWWHVRRPARAYPWLADLLLTVVAFSDILGNRLDLYDSVVVVRRLHARHHRHLRRRGPRAAHDAPHVERPSPSWSARSRWA